MIPGGCLRNAALFGHVLSLGSLLSGQLSRYVTNSCPSLTPCDFSPCANGATCLPLGATSPSCACYGRYTGRFCTSEFTSGSYSQLITPPRHHGPRAPPGPPPAALPAVRPAGALGAAGGGGGALGLSGRTAVRPRDRHLPDGRGNRHHSDAGLVAARRDPAPPQPGVARVAIYRFLDTINTFNFKLNISMPGKGKSRSASPKKTGKKGKRRGKKRAAGPTGPPKEPLTHTEIVDAYYVCHNAAHFLTYTGFVKPENKKGKKGRKAKKKK